MTTPRASEVMQDLIGAFKHVQSHERTYLVTGTWGASDGRTVSATVRVTDGDGSTHTVRIEVHDMDPEPHDPTAYFAPQ